LLCEVFVEEPLTILEKGEGSGLDQGGYGVIGEKTFAGNGNVVTFADSVR